MMVRIGSGGMSKPGALRGTRSSPRFATSPTSFIDRARSHCHSSSTRFRPTWRGGRTICMNCSRRNRPNEPGDDARDCAGRTGRRTSIGSERSGIWPDCARSRSITSLTASRQQAPEASRSTCSIHRPEKFSDRHSPARRRTSLRLPRQPSGPSAHGRRPAVKLTEAAARNRRRDRGPRRRDRAG